MPAPSTPKRLKFRALPGFMVWDYNAALGGSNRFMGRRYDPSAPSAEAGGESLHPADEALDYADLPEHAHALQAVRDGELEAADEYTARRAGVEFKQAQKAAPQGSAQQAHGAEGEV